VVLLTHLINFFLIADKDGEEVMKGSGDVAGGNLTYKLGDNAGAGNGTFFEVDEGNGKFTFTKDSNDTKVGINTTAPTKALQVLGDISASGDFSSPNFSSTAGHITASGNISGSGLDVRNFTIKHHKTEYDAFSNAQATGEILENQLLHTSVAAGDVVYMTGGTWRLADANAGFAANAINVLGVALASGAGYGDVLMRGVARLGAGHITDTSGQEGDPVYLGETAGHVQFAAPSDSGDYVRIVGYVLNEANDIIYFNPDNTYIEVA